MTPPRPRGRDAHRDPAGRARLPAPPPATGREGGAAQPPPPAVRRESAQPAPPAVRREAGKRPAARGRPGAGGRAVPGRPAAEPSTSTDFAFITLPEILGLIYGGEHRRRSAPRPRRPSATPDPTPPPTSEDPREF